MSEIASVVIRGIVLKIVEFIDNTPLSDLQRYLITNALEKNTKRSFTCPICGMTSYNPADAEHGYCGRCHSFTRHDNYDGAPDTFVQNDPPGPSPQQLQDIRDAGRPGQ